MGDCYPVELRVKLRKSTKSNMQKLMRQWMRVMEKGFDYGGQCKAPGVDWSLQGFRRAGIRPDSFTGICKILLAFQQGDARHVVDAEGFDLYRSGFNASYGWGVVMVNAFYRMSWALEEGSYLDIDRDEGREIYEIEIDDKGEAEVWENHRPPCVHSPQERGGHA